MQCVVCSLQTAGLSGRRERVEDRVCLLDELGPVISIVKCDPLQNHSNQA